MRIKLLLCMILVVESVVGFYELNQVQSAYRTFNFAKLKKTSLTLKNTIDLPVEVTVYYGDESSEQIALSPQESRLVKNDQQFIASITYPKTHYALFDEVTAAISFKHNNADHLFLHNDIPLVDFDRCAGNSPDALPVYQKGFTKFIAPGNDTERYVLCSITTRQLYDFLKNLYNKNKGYLKQPDAQPRIPKIIHQIWLGAVFPEKYYAWHQSWIKNHPNWLHIMWVDNPQNYQLGRLVGSLAELEKLIKSGTADVVTIDVKQFNFRRKSLFDGATNYGEKSDVLRYELLYNYGGMYVDTDFECFEPFDILHHSFDFYTGCGAFCCHVNNGLIGSSAHHFIMDYCIVNGKSKNECAHLDRLMYEGCATLGATGPALFARAIVAVADQEKNRDIVFPSSYFYPEFCEELSILGPESFGMHYSEVSWGPKPKTGLYWFADRVRSRLMRYSYYLFDYCENIWTTIVG